MKNLKFQSLLLLSKKERAARKIVFDPKATLILGENDTGKSSLIKAIYATFGADPAVIHPDWKSLGVDSSSRVRRRRHAVPAPAVLEYLRVVRP